MLIVGGRVVDPAQDLDAVRDLRIVDGRVMQIGEHLEPHFDEEVLDARGAIVAPGFVDMHVHLRDPGFPEKETLATGTLAAARGGFTAVACMPNTQPALDAPSAVAAVAHPHPTALQCRVYPIAAITRERKGAELLDYAGLVSAGAVAFSDDGNTVMNARVLRDAAIAARSVRGVFISHALDEHLHDGAAMHDGALARELGVRGSPGVAEDVIVARDLIIARETGKPWHIAHVSTAASAALVEEAKRAGVAVTCEVTPHHLAFTDERVRELRGGAKVNPPLRTQSDVNALRAAVLRGEIDAFATDHAPHTQAEKSAALRDAAVGFTGLEIAVGAYGHALPELPASRFVAMLSTNPARILGVPGGTLARGSVGDVTVYAERPWRVDPTQFASKGRSTPFAGMTLPLSVRATVVAGVVRYRA